MNSNRLGSPPKGVKLNLGCGPVQPPGWVNVDGSNRAFLASKLSWLDQAFVKLHLLAATEFNRSTKYLNLRNGLPYRDGSVSCIYAGELWEHFEYADAARLTAECFRVLMPSGVLRVCVPDGPVFWGKYVELYNEEIAKPADARDPSRLVAHVQMFFDDICTRRIFLGSMGHTHKWQFDEVQLVDMLAQAGFRPVERMKFHESRIPDVESVERSDFLIGGRRKTGLVRNDSVRTAAGERMDVSFIILTWNSERYVEACLSHIKAALASTSMRYEIRILDNGSRDSTPALLRRLAAEDPDRIVPRFEPENLGTSGSRNILSAAATGTYLCVMDSDVELRPGVLEGLLRALESDRERIGIVAPKIVYPDGRWQKSIDRFPTLFDKIHRFLRLRQIEAREGLDAESWDEPRYVDYAISAFWLVRRDIWNEVGQLDERIFYAPEDVDFCLRVWRHGYRILYVPTVSVVHHTQEISRGLILNRAKLNHVKGLLYYFMKHRYVLRRPRFQVGEIH